MERQKCQMCTISDLFTEHASFARNRTSTHRKHEDADDTYFFNVSDLVIEDAGSAERKSAVEVIKVLWHGVDEGDKSF